MEAQDTPHSCWQHNSWGRGDAETALLSPTGTSQVCIRIEPEVEMAPLWIPTQGTTNYISFHWAIGCLEQGFQGTKAFYWTRRVACLRTPTDAVVQVMLSSGTRRTTLSGFITCINIRNWVGIAFCEDRKNPNISEFQALIYTKQVGISVTITPNK